MSECRRGFGLDIGFIDYVNTQLVTKPSYSAIADLRTLQITLQPAVSHKWLPGNCL
jgi:hypothetical protein